MGKSGISLGIHINFCSNPVPQLQPTIKSPDGRFFVIIIVESTVIIIHKYYMASTSFQNNNMSQSYTQVARQTSPDPVVQPKVESIVNFDSIWFYLFFGFCVAIILMTIMRFFLLWYWRIDKIINLLENIKYNTEQKDVNSKDLSTPTIEENKN